MRIKALFLAGAAALMIGGLTGVTGTALAEPQPTAPPSPADPSAPPSPRPCPPSASADPANCSPPAPAPRP
ncbi:MAG TPA: hypothetical protein VHJ17_15085, partial [Thermomonospora sp.]|nr:hypothetical protein [Thermomonospora sp.]